MIIRSQDKKTIVNFNNIDTICTARIGNDTKAIKEEYETVIKYFNGGEETIGTLGEYSTEEKAIKVLDMIQDAYEKQNIFQMPQDEDVLDWGNEDAE